jgi:hypothetical protein
MKLTWEAPRLNKISSVSQSANTIGSGTDFDGCGSILT